MFPQRFQLSLANRVRFENTESKLISTFALLLVLWQQSCTTDAPNVNLIRVS
uniref:Uncharacterized protein n=1 Tax=Arundo donax TaxID=35708 RepID=A0A0A8ZSH4_ARUDO